MKASKRPRANASANVIFLIWASQHTSSTIPIPPATCNSGNAEGIQELTFSTTLLTRDELRLAGLVEHELLQPLAEKDKKRWLFVTQEVADLLSGKQNPGAMFPCAKADGVIGRYSRGWIVSFTKKPVGKADFKKLSNLDEAFSITFPGPGSGWRMFGRFARKNVFVGLSCYERGDCAPWAMYNKRAADMIADWEARFSLGPLRGASYADYVGDPFRDDDEL